MADPYKEKNKDKDSRIQYDNDVDRMINEGMAGGNVGQEYHKAQIEEARILPKNDDPFPTTTQARLEEDKKE
ncbi:hypothetical protein [Salirhabdus sp. Marseille-P4669]|uniref:hypothetical protein n=1 Tax=Salirhabdus sp. Marseille-P4669 TaxID=2042310 RepID=UPI000C7E418B|nr:hypothetical protein [Salirhabdus sp. Marseille-P4669]